MSKHSGAKGLNKMLNKNKDQKIKTQRLSVAQEDLESTPKPQLLELSAVGKEKRSRSASFSQPVGETRSNSRNAVKQNGSLSRVTRHKKQNIFSSLRGMMAGVFKTRSKGDDALDFAANHRRRSKREKRRRFVLIYGGIALVLAAALIIVFTLPHAKETVTAAPVVQAEGQAVSLMAAQTDMGIAALGAKLPYHMPFGSAFADTADDDSGFDTDDFDTDFDTDIDTDFDVTDPDTDEDITPIATTSPDPTPVPLKVEDFLDFFEIKADAYYSDVRYSSNTYKYTREEYLMLARIIHGEARGQSYKGQVAVGNVVMNRVLCRAWPDTITGVVSQGNGGQFSPYPRVKDLSESSINSTSKRAARAILERELWVIPQDVYFFRSASRYKSLKGQNWGSHAYYGELGGHLFYRHNYSGRARGLGVPAALFERTYKYAQYGCKPGKHVYRIQYMLNKLGYKVKADSYFGETTKVALIDFQEKYNLKADGVAGPSTVKRLIQEFGIERYYQRFIKK